MFKIQITDVRLISYFDAPFLRNPTKLDLKYKLQTDYGKGKDRFALEQTMKFQRGSRGAGLLLLAPRRLIYMRV